MRDCTEMHTIKALLPFGLTYVTTYECAFSILLTTMKNKARNSLDVHHELRCALRDMESRFNRLASCRAFCIPSEERSTRWPVHLCITEKGLVITVHLMTESVEGTHTTVSQVLGHYISYERMRANSLFECKVSWSSVVYIQCI